MKKILALFLLATAPAGFAALAELQPAITAALTEELEVEGAELVLTSVRPLPKVEVPDGFPLSVKITLAPAQGLAAFMTVKFSVTVGDQQRGEQRGLRLRRHLRTRVRLRLRRVCRCAPHSHQSQPHRHRGGCASIYL